jgi:hypothetical protein
MTTHIRNPVTGAEKARQHSLDAAAGDADEGPEAGAHVLRPLDQSHGHATQRRVSIERRRGSDSSEAASEPRATQKGGKKMEPLRGRCS